MDVWNEWRACGFTCPPIGYLLRAALPGRWLRIHSLPSGKRYPDGANDRVELLHRHNVVASAVLGTGSDCLAIITTWEPAPAVGASWTFAAPDAWLLNEDEREGLALARFLWRTVRWRPGELDEEVLAVAEERIGHLTVFSPRTGNVYCPYDGGADLFVAQPADAAALASLFARWRSDLVGGL